MIGVEIKYLLTQANCLMSAFKAQHCDIFDEKCPCSNEIFQGHITGCMATACTIPEALSMSFDRYYETYTNSLHKVAINDTIGQCGNPLIDTDQSLVIISYSLAGFTVIFVVLRFICKRTIPKLAVSLDDWLTLAALLFIIPSAFIIDYGLDRNGLGRDIWTLTPDEITSVLMYFHILTWIYFLSITLIKLAIISFYLQIFPSQNTRQVLWITFSFTAAWGTSFVLVAIFQCHPVQYFWTGWDGMHKGSCRNANAIAWSNAASNISLDLWILAIPLWKLRKLHLHWKKKIGVSCMLFVGTL